MSVNVCLDDEVLASDIDYRNMYAGCGNTDREFFKALAKEYDFHSVSIDYARYGAQEVHIYAVFDMWQSRHTFIRVGGHNGLYTQEYIRKTLRNKLKG